MKLELLNRALTAAAFVALAITLGVWLTRSPLTAAPKPDAAPATPVKTHPAKPAAPQPTLAPLPLGPTIPPANTVTTEVEISYEIAPLPPASVVAAPPAAKATVGSYLSVYEVWDKHNISYHTPSSGPNN